MENISAKTFSKDNVDSTEDRSVEDYLAEFFFGCNIPFNVVESEFFRNFVNRLAPDYKPPSAKALSSSILDKTYASLIKTHGLKENEKCVLLIDGWKNKARNEKYVVATIHNASGEKLFLDSYDFTEKSETGSLLAEVAKKAVEYAKEKYKVEIYAVVSDNVSTMMKMGRESNLWHTTCDSHNGNLLAKDLVDKTFNSQVVEVLVEFKKSQLERQLLNLGGTHVKLPGETRWCSYRDSYRCCLKNLSIMKEIVENADFTVKQEVVELLLDKSFEDKLLNYIIIFDVVCQLVNKCQQDNFNIADAVEEWLSLRFPIHDENYEVLLKNRLKKVIKPITLAANILHRKYKGKKFANNEDFVAMAEDFFKQHLSKTGLEELSHYRNEKGIFESLEEICMTNPIAFWTLAEANHSELAQFAKKLLKIPSSTAAIERLFSQWSFVHNKLRNRLTAEKSKKLIHIYYTLNMRQSYNQNKDFY